MTRLARRHWLGRTLVDAHCLRVAFGDVVDCVPNDRVWIAAEGRIRGFLGPGRHALSGTGSSSFLRDVLGRADFQVYFVALEAIPTRQTGTAFAYERDLNVVAELPFQVSVALRVGEFDRLYGRYKGMLDIGAFQPTIERESGLMTKKIIQDVAWRLPGEELLSFASRERVAQVEATLVEWWDTYHLVPEQFALQVDIEGPLAHALESRDEGEPAEIDFGKRVVLMEENGTQRTGVITDVQGRRANVHWDDGGASWVGSVLLKKAPAREMLALPGHAPGPGAASPVRPFSASSAAAAFAAPPPGSWGFAPPARRATVFCPDGVWRPASVLGWVNGWWDAVVDGGPRAWFAPSQVRF